MGGLSTSFRNGREHRTKKAFLYVTVYGIAYNPYFQAALLWRCSAASH